MSKLNTPTVVITHHAVSLKTHRVDDVNNWHYDRWPTFMSRRGFNAGYHYVIDWDGTLTQTRDHEEEGAHTIGMNTSSIGVCFMGNFDNHYPSDKQMATWNWLYTQLRDIYPDIPTMPHRAYANKSCHGALLADDHFQFDMIKQKLVLIEQLKRLVAKLTVLLTKRRMK